MKYAIIALSLLIVGCSNTSTRIASVCDKSTQKMLFIPYSTTETCVGVMAGESEGSIQLPPRTMPHDG